MLAGVAIEGGEEPLALVGEVFRGEVRGCVKFAIEEVEEGWFVGAIEWIVARSPR